MTFPSIEAFRKLFKRIEYVQAMRGDGTLTAHAYRMALDSIDEHAAQLLAVEEIGGNMRRIIGEHIRHLHDDAVNQCHGADRVHRLAMAKAAANAKAAAEKMVTDTQRQEAEREFYDEKQWDNHRLVGQLTDAHMNRVHAWY